MYNTHFLAQYFREKKGCTFYIGGTNPRVCATQGKYGKIFFFNGLSHTVKRNTLHLHLWMSQKHG